MSADPQGPVQVTVAPGRSVLVDGVVYGPGQQVTVSPDDWRQMDADGFILRLDGFPRSWLGRSPQTVVEQSGLAKAQEVFGQAQTAGLRDVEGEVRCIMAPGQTMTLANQRFVEGDEVTLSWGQAEAALAAGSVVRAEREG